MEHIRGLLEDRESLTAEYETENQELRHELQQIKQQQGEVLFSMLLLAFLPSLPYSFIHICNVY